MKRIKSSKGYGALEYTLLIAIVVIIALFFFLSIKNKDSTSAIEKGMDAVNDFIGSSPGGSGGTGGGSSNIVVEFPGGTKPTFEVKEGDDLDEDQVKEYITDKGIIVKDKDGNLIDFGIENVDIKIDEPTYIQFEVVYEGSKETVIVPGSINGLADGCVLAGDDDFVGETDGGFWYKGDDSCVKIPNVIKGVNITSYYYMFFDSKVSKVISSNKNVVNMEGMFSSLSSELFDLIWLESSNVTNMSYMFDNADIKFIRFVGRFDTSKVEDMSWMFFQSKILEINFGSNFNTSNVINMDSMFNESHSESLNLSNFNTSNVNSMSAMFARSQAKSLDLSSFNTSKVIDMEWMFLESKAVDINFGSNFNTSNVTNMNSMFSDSKATSLDLSSFDTSNVINMRWMFADSQITTIDLSSFNFAKADVDSMFTGAQTTSVLVKDEASQTKLNNSSNKPAHTTISIK